VTSAFLEVPVLRGHHVVLEPLASEHEAELSEAVLEGELWRLWVTRIPSPEGMAAEIQRRLTEHETGTMVP
jgi:N-acetyltransferase